MTNARLRLVHRGNHVPCVPFFLKRGEPPGPPRPPRSRARGWPVSAPPSSPFKGLNAFDDSELDALLFFGREREREIVVANLIASRLTVLTARVGSASHRF